MERRFVQILVVLAWLVSSAWLVTAKLWPLAFSRQPPRHQVVGPGTEQLPSRIRWHIEIGKEKIGTATVKIDRPPFGSPIVDSEVRLERLPLGKILDQLTGVWPMVARSAGLTGRQLEIALCVHSRMHFDAFGELLFFQSTIDVDRIDDLVRIRGSVVEGNKLQLIVSTGDGMPPDTLGQKDQLVTHTIPLNPHALVVDAFTPHPFLGGIRIGQEWTMESLQPFAPGHPVRRTRARVIRQELLPWGREMETMFVVRLEDIEPHGLTANQKSRGRLWVRTNGDVVRQQLDLGGVVVDFTRMRELSITGAPTNPSESDD